jgi:hypothetical protein
MILIARGKAEGAEHPDSREVHHDIAR